MSKKREIILIDNELGLELRFSSSTNAAKFIKLTTEPTRAIKSIKESISGNLRGKYINSYGRYQFKYA